MKVEPNFTDILERHGAFFAFGQKQFEAAKAEGVEYVSLFAGLIAPVANAKAVLAEIEAEAERVKKIDLEQNSAKDIIWRELSNYETQITGDLSDALAALSGYGITTEMVEAEYYLYYKHCVDNDCF